MAEALKSLTHAITLQGPQQTLAILRGQKLIENRAWSISPGWYGLHVGAQRKSEWGQKAAAVCPDMPPEEKLTFSAIVGLFYISEQRRPEECAGDFWAVGPICHVVSKVVPFLRPIPHRGEKGLWPLREEVLQRISDHAARCTVVHHDLSPIGTGRARAWSRGGRGRGRASPAE